MGLKETLEKLRKELPEDSGEAKTLIADAIREAGALSDDFKSVTKESIDRKEKIRDLSAQVETLNEKVNSANDPKAQELVNKWKADSEHLAQLQAESDNKVISQWAEKAKLFAITKDDKRFETVDKIRSKFVFAEEGKTLSVEDAKRNLDAYELLELSGALGIPQDKTPGNPPAPNPNDPPKDNPFAGKFK